MKRLYNNICLDLDSSLSMVCHIKLLGSMQSHWRILGFGILNWADHMKWEAAWYAASTSELWSQTNFSWTWGGVRHIFHVPDGEGSTLFSKLYKGQGLSKPTPSYDQKSISGILECYSKMKIFFALCTKSPFLNIYNSNSNRLIILFTYCLLYLLLHIYTLFHHPIEELESQTSWGVNHFFNPRRGVRIFSHVLRLSAIWKPSFCCLVPNFLLNRDFLI